MEAWSKVLWEHWKKTLEAFLDLVKSVADKFAELAVGVTIPIICIDIAQFVIDATNTLNQLKIENTDLAQNEAQIGVHLKTATTGVANLKDGTHWKDAFPW